MNDDPSPDMECFMRLPQPKHRFGWSHLGRAFLTVVFTVTSQLPQVVGPVLAQTQDVAQRTSADQTAIDLARQFRSADAVSAPSTLRQALARSGYGIVSDRGQILATPNDPSVGLAFYDWEVDAMAEAADSGGRLSLSDLGASIRASIPEVENAPVETDILDGLRADATGGKPQLRFWAWFVAALDTDTSGSSFPLLDSRDPAQILLNPVQVTLILQRLGGDLLALNEKAKNAAADVPAVAAAVSTTREGDMSAAGWVGLAQPIGQTAGPECNMSETDHLVVDGHALGTALGFDKLMDYLKEHLGPAAHSSIPAYQKLAARANLALAWAKLLAIVNAFHADFTMDPPPALERTKLAGLNDDGQNARLTATARLNLGKLEWVNCLRVALNDAGLDVDIPPDGPLSDTPRQWQLAEGGDIVQFFGGDTVHGQMNEEGTTSIGIQGKRQPKEVPDTAQPVTKRAAVRLCVQAEKGGVLKDVLDAGLTVIGGPSGLLGTGITALLLRTQCLLSAKYTFDVIDWEQMYRLRFRAVMHDAVPGQWEDNGVVEGVARLAFPSSDEIASSGSDVVARGSTGYGQWEAHHREPKSLKDACSWDRSGNIDFKWDPITGANLSGPSTSPNGDPVIEATVHRVDAGHVGIDLEVNVYYTPPCVPWWFRSLGSNYFGETDVKVGDHITLADGVRHRSAPLILPVAFGVPATSHVADLEQVTDWTVTLEEDSPQQITFGDSMEGPTVTVP